MKLNSRSRAARRGSALLTSLVAMLVIAGMTAALLALTGRVSRERASSGADVRALAVAEAGLANAIAEIRTDVFKDFGAPGAIVPFSGGGFWGSVDRPDPDTAVVRSFGQAGNSVRAIEATLVRNPGGVFTSALFAGNSSNDPAYDMGFGGVGAQADEIDGNVYSGGNLVVKGDATISGTARAAGTIDGVGGKAGQDLPIPDIAGMKYETHHDVNVAAEFASATWKSNSLGGKAWQLPEDNRAHILRKNPDDRTGDTSKTAKDDYFLEDPYEAVSGSSTVDPSKGTHLSLAGLGGKPGSNGSDLVYYIDGNLWIHNRNIFSFTVPHSPGEPARVTIVVRGNVYFSDNVLFEDPDSDALAFIAIKDPAETDSGNIYFGDPTFGTLERMDAFMYAENNFYDNNLSATGSATVTVNGNMTAGNHVKIQRDFGTEHSKLTVNFDDRLATGKITLPGLPKQSGAGPTWSVRLWREIPAQ